MSDIKHASLPFVVVPTASACASLRIISETETFVFDQHDRPQQIAYITKNYGENTSIIRKDRETANAEFIVNACNNHYELLEALKEAHHQMMKAGFMHGGDQRKTVENVSDIIAKVGAS